MNDTPTTNTINQIAPPRGPIKAVHVCFAKYIDFNGRASRSEFWWFFLFLLLGETIAKVLGLHFHTDAECRATPWLDRPDHCFVLSNCTICELWKLAVLLPSYAVVVRRLRDIGRSVWWVLLRVPFEIVVLIPAADDSIWSHVAVFIWMPLLVMMCFRGKSNAVAIHPTNKLRRWFVARLENRIDRLWLGGVFGVTALVTVLLDARYVALFLFGYFLVFFWRTRDQICAASQPGKPRPPIKNLIGFHIVMFFILQGVCLGGALLFNQPSAVNAYFSAFSLGMLINGAVLLGFFVINHRRLFAYYHVECLSMRAGENSEIDDRPFLRGFMPLCNFLRPLAALLGGYAFWCGATSVLLHRANQIDGQHGFPHALFAEVLKFTIVVQVVVVLVGFFLAALLSRKSRSR